MSAIDIYFGNIVLDKKSYETSENSLISKSLWVQHNHLLSLTK